jgi:membrane-associated phospholipid phosphatase
MQRSLLALLACAAALGVVLFRFLGTRWARGERFDVSAVQDGLSQLAVPRAQHATPLVLGTISVSSLAFVGAGLIAFALVRGRTDLGAACAVLLIGAPVTSELLKRELHPIGTQPSLHASFPSGHATVALAVGLSLTMVVPRNVRVVTAVLGGVYAFAIGSALVITSAHFPSDVAGGFCVATAWAAAAALLVRRPADTRLPLRLFAGLALLVFVTSAAVLLLHPGIAVRAQLHPRLLEALVGIGTLAAVCVAAFTTAIAVVKHLEA